MKLLKNILIRIAAVLFGLIIAFGIGEVVIRLLYKSKIVLYPRYHSAIQYGDFQMRRLRPNTAFIHTSVDGSFHFKTNNHGFRSDYDVDYKKPDGFIRVLSLGDSHTEGFEVDQHQTFSYLCEQALNQHGLKAQVLNCGISGSSNSEEMVFLLNEGLKYKPDAVVLGFYANDFDDNLKDGLYSLKNDSLINTAKKYQPGVKLQDFIYQFAIIRWLSENSYLYSFAFNAIWNSTRKSMIEKRKSETNSDISQNENNDEMAVASDSTISDYKGKLAVKILSHIYEVCKQNQIRFIIVDIPKCHPFNSSIPEKYVSDFRTCCDTLFYAMDLKSEYAALPETHVPHGQFHISSYSHALIGSKISSYLLNQYNKN